MSTFFSSGWEAGTGILDSVWTSENGTYSILSVATDQFFQGAHSLKCIEVSYDTGYIEYDFSAISTVGLRFAFRVHAAPPSGQIQLASIYGQTNFILTNTTFYWNTGNGGPGTAIGTAFVFSLDTWYQVEVLYTQPGIAWRVWNAGGNTILAGPYSGTSAEGTTVSSIYLGVLAGGNTAGTFWIDSLVADNAAYPGPIVTSFYPLPSSNPTY